MMHDAVIEPFTENDLGPLRDLFGSHFPAGNRLLAPEYSRWLYGENPFGNAQMVKVLEGSRLVGFMAMIPVTLTRLGEVLSAYYVVNVLVHPDYHGKHLFSRMIKAAMACVEKEQAALLGHPNKMALIFWQRARMHFHEALRPSLALPRPWELNTRARNIASPAELEPLRDPLGALLCQSSFWRVAATPEYLTWRFLTHPTNKYHLQTVERHGEVIGIQVSKRVKPGVSMLIDQFLPEEAQKAGTGKLPACTVCLLPESATIQVSSGKLAIPLKKRIPFFMTRPAAPVDASAVALIGLSPSDF